MGAFDQPDYEWALTDPERFADEYRTPARPAIPTLCEPDQLPRVDHDCGEPLVEVRHRNIRCMDAYWHAGWQHAIPQTWLRAGAAMALCDVADRLGDGWGLAILDAWRPPELQAEIREAANAAGVDAGYVSTPSDDPATPAPHTTGGTVDVTLTWRGHALELGSHFDEFTADAHTLSYDVRSSTRDRLISNLRRHLYWTMRDAGFICLDIEWWHFEHGTPRWAAVTGNTPKYARCRPHHPHNTAPSGGVVAE